MADGALLGCPHCGKPIAFAQELAGKLAACPHCRGPFQMPASSPASAPPTPAHTSGSMQSQRRVASNLGFDPDEPPALPIRQGKEPPSYASAESVSLLVCICGIVFSLMVGVILVLNFIVPTFQLPGTRTFFTAFLGSIAVLAMLVGGITVSLLLRHLVQVLVDAARKRQ